MVNALQALQYSVSKICWIMNCLIRSVIRDYSEELGNGKNEVTLSSEIPGTWD